MEKFNFIRKEQYNCIENVWVTLLSTKGIDYPLMFAENWGFTLFPPERENQRIGFRIGGGEYKVMDCLSDYIGIHTKYYETDDIEAQINLLNQELNEGHYVMAEADSYYFPWKSVGDRHDFIHYGLIVGRDEKTGDYQCLDPFENSELNPLSRENLMKGKLHCMTIRKGKPTKTIVWQEIIKRAAEIMLLENGVNGIEGMRKFADEVSKHFEIAEEIKEFEEMIWLAPIIFRISDVGSRRLNFSECLNYLGDKYSVEVLSTYGKALEKIGGKWRRIRRIMVTSATDKEKDYIPMLVQLINEIADEEEKIALNLMQLASEV